MVVPRAISGAMISSHLGCKPGAEHLFATLPFYDIVDTDASVIMHLDHRSDIANTQGRCRVG